VDILDRFADELMGPLHAGHRPRSEHKLGLEMEVFPVLPDGRPIPYEGPRGVEELLKEVALRTGWQEKQEAGRTLGLQAQHGSAITLEPGAQLEFNSSPCTSIVALEGQMEELFQHLRVISREWHIDFLTLGSQPWVSPAEVVRIPKSRYDILEPQLVESGELGLWMMKTTCGIQVNFDHSDEVDAARKLALAFVLAPAFNALFANSAVRAGEPSGFVSWRGHVWSQTDPARCGIVEACSREDSTLEDYVRWALDAPMLLVDRGDSFVDMRGHSFSEFLRAGKARPGDWEQHLSFLFPEVRLRPQLELRSVDGGPPEMALALCALVRAVFEDEQVFDFAWQEWGCWNHVERVAMWHDVHRLGLGASLPDGRPLLGAVRRLFDSLRPSAEDAPYLGPLEAILNRGFSAGEIAEEHMRGTWGGEISRLVAENLLSSSRRS